MPGGYTQIYENEWMEPVRKGFRLRCCDCGLVHRIDFRLRKVGRGRVIQFRFHRVPHRPISGARSMKKKKE